MAQDMSGGHPDMDYDEHKRTYAAFIRGSQILVVLVALILIGMAIFLT